MYHLGVVWVFFHILIKSFYIIHENLSQSLFKNVFTKLELTIIFINFGYSLIRLKLTNFALSDTCIYTYMNSVIYMYTQNDIQRNTYLKSLFKSHCRYRVINNRCIYIHPRLKNIHCFFTSLACQIINP